MCIGLAGFCSIKSQRLVAVPEISLFFTGKTMMSTNRIGRPTHLSIRNPYIKLTSYCSGNIKTKADLCCAFFDSVSVSCKF